MVAAARERSYFALPGMCDLLDTIAMYMGNPLPEYNSPLIWMPQSTNPDDSFARRFQLHSRLFSIRQVLTPGELGQSRIFMVHNNREVPIILQLRGDHSRYYTPPIMVTCLYHYCDRIIRICGYTLFEAYEWNIYTKWILHKFYDTDYVCERIPHAQGTGYYSDEWPVDEHKKWLCTGHKIYSNPMINSPHVEVPWPTHWPPGAKTVRKYPYFDGEYWCYMTEYGLWIQDRDGTWCYL